MLRPFRLKKPIGPDSDMDRDDVLATKRALGALGFLEAPDYGLTPFPDQPMIGAVKVFQRRHGLRVDGVMNPDGPTAETLGRVIAERGAGDHSRNIVEGEWDWMPDLPRPPHRLPSTMPAPQQCNHRPPSNVFDILADIGAGRRNHPHDVLAARRALAWAGHMPAEAADNRFGDGADLFDAMRSFQLASGLKADGWMKPGGETARALNDAIGPKIQAQQEKSNQDEPSEAGANRPGPQIAKMDKPPFPGRGLDGSNAASIPSGVGGGGGGAAAIGAGAIIHEIIRRQQQKRDGPGTPLPTPSPDGTSPRTDMAPPLPPLPGYEPPEGFRQPTKEEILPTPEFGPPTEIFPEPGERKTVLESFPDQSDEFVQALILESRGKPETQLDTDYAIVAYDRAVKKWKLKGEHTRGGHSPDERKEYRPERFIKPKGGIRGARPDGTFEIDDGQQDKIIEDLQTVDTLKDGLTPDARERRNAARIEALKGLHEERGAIGLFPKSHGKPREQWEKEIDAMVENHFRKRYGLPPDER